MATKARRYVDVVAILDSANQPVLTGAEYLRASVYEVARLMEHPLEDGSLTADHIVFQPVEIDIPLMFTGPNAKQGHIELRKLFLAATKLIVQTRVDQYGFMVITEIPHDEVPDAADAITVNIRLREAIFVSAIYGGLAPAQVKRPAQASTRRKGQQQTTTPAAPKAAAAATQYKGSTLYRLTRRGG